MERGGTPRNFPVDEIVRVCARFHLGGDGLESKAVGKG